MSYSGRCQPPPVCFRAHRKEVKHLFSIDLTNVGRYVQEGSSRKIGGKRNKKAQSAGKMTFRCRRRKSRDRQTKKNQDDEGVSTAGSRRERNDKELPGISGRTEEGNRKPNRGRRRKRETDENQLNPRRWRNKHESRGETRQREERKIL